MLFWLLLFVFILCVLSYVVVFGVVSLLWVVVCSGAILMKKCLFWNGSAWSLWCVDVSCWLCVVFVLLLFACCLLCVVCRLLWFRVCCMLCVRRSYDVLFLVQCEFLLMLACVSCLFFVLLAVVF